MQKRRHCITALLSMPLLSRFAWAAEEGEAQEKSEAHYFETLGCDKRVSPIEGNSLDPLSVFFFVRNRKIDFGTVIKGPMTDGKRCKVARIECVERKTIKVNGR